MCFWHVWLVRPALFTATKTCAGWVQRSATLASTCLLSFSFFFTSFCYFSSFSASTLKDSTWSWITFQYKLWLCANSHQSSESLQLFNPLTLDHFSDTSAHLLHVYHPQRGTPTAVLVGNYHSSEICSQGSGICTGRELSRVSVA